MNRNKILTVALIAVSFGIPVGIAFGITLGDNLMIEQIEGDSVLIEQLEDELQEKIEEIEPLKNDMKYLQSELSRENEKYSQLEKEYAWLCDLHPYCKEHVIQR